MTGPVTQAARFTSASNRAGRAVRKARRAQQIVDALDELDGVYVQIAGLTAARELLDQAGAEVLGALAGMKALRAEGFAGHAAPVEPGVFPRIESTPKPLPL